jgi:hypothetical protein
VNDESWRIQNKDYRTSRNFLQEEGYLVYFQNYDGDEAKLTLSEKIVPDSSSQFMDLGENWILRNRIEMILLNLPEL